MLRVTNRIIERSRDTRTAYLARINQAKTDTVHRAQLACGNLAHGFAACQSDDKASLKSMLRNNIAIITSYNDMLSAHQPYEYYPDIIRKALHSVNAVGQVAGAFRRCAMVSLKGRTGWNSPPEPRSDCNVGRYRPVA
jgi:phosphogluconate dehydratase